MANSVVKVTDSMLNDSLLLLVGEDGTVTPDKQTVETFLNAQSGVTNIQLMHINKSDGESIDVAVENVIYAPDADEVVVEETMDEAAQILHNIKLDHDYTTLTEPPIVEEDELAKTLSILDGNGEDLPIQKIIPVQTEKETVPAIKSSKTVVISKTEPPPLAKVGSKRTKSRSKSKYEQDDDYKGEEPGDSEENDSDTDFQSVKRQRLSRRDSKENKIKSPKPAKVKTIPIVEKPVEKSPPILSETKSPEKKDSKGKKDKKPANKPIPDDFALFSTPDIIRRVGGKDPGESPESKPAKIENRSRSASESQSIPAQKTNRLSLDSKSPKSEHSKEHKKPVSEPKTKRNSIDTAKPSEVVTTASPSSSFTNVTEPTPTQMGAFDTNQLLDSSTLDGTGLDLDPSLLDNINNDLISEDILYQVAQSLVSNPELQNAIDKSLNEAGNLDLANPGLIPEVAPVQSEQEATADQKGTQIVRPDGRIVLIPPIERPTTRSRNKKKDVDGVKSAPKFTHKPLDEEHVSGNELDSEEEEEESEDDPNKLWCICNQPHNNRFMICCDTCEEWYHGKCVNITKAMGQQMESEGKEWICLFCKDPHLKRPQAAARRIRKASRNSRQSTDSSTSGTKQNEPPTSTTGGSVPCVVCQKPSRTNSIFCSESCILAHAQGVERVVVFERATGNMLTGNKAPSAANLEQWLREHPGYEVVRSAGKVVTTKQPPLTQSKLKLVKNTENDGVSLAVSKKGVNVGILKHSPKVGTKSPSVKTPVKIKTKGGTPVPNKSPQRAVIKAKITQTISKGQPSSTTSSPSVAKDKAVPVKTPKSRQAETTSNTSPAAQPKQENIRENVQKTIFEQLTNRLKLVDDLKLSETELKTISTDIESQLYKCFGDTGQKYRNKYRSLIFNIKDVKNQTLWRRICEKSINPYQLVRLSPDDMASQELALWREREAKHQLDMIKKSELELLNCNRQYVLKTHKGEQVLEDNRPTDTIDNTEVITSLTDGDKSTTEGTSPSKKDVDKKKHSKDKEKKSSSKDRRHRSTSKDGYDRNRKRSRSRDRKHTTDRRRSRSRGRDRHRKSSSSHKSSRHKKDSHRGSSTEKLDKKSKEILEQLVDNKIVLPLEDGEWKHGAPEEPVPAPVAESDSDHEPSSTVTIPTPPRSTEFDDTNPTTTSDPSTKTTPKTKPEKEEDSTSTIPSSPKQPQKSQEIWRGIINMIDVAQISITAHEVSGDCTGLGTDLPSNLDIVGRISPETVWDYIGKMRCSNSKIISLVRLNAINEEEKMPYLALYSYLSSRNRLGVVKSTNKAVKDYYIWPLAAQKPIPQALLPINGPGFEEDRPALLLGIIVRDKRKRMSTSSVLDNPVKRTKVDVAVVTPTARSYTPPPSKDIRSKLPLPPAVVEQDDADEPYSPEDSDPDSAPPPAPAPATFLEPFANKFDDVIPGLETPATVLPSSTQEIQRQMEKLNKEIEMQKSEIDSISQNIATASTEIGTSALASIALPSNLQQILDSIKTIGAVSTGDAPQVVSKESGKDLTIPLMLPTSFGSRTTIDTIPLNLPKKGKDGEEKGSVLSSLSEEDLIRKAEEMLGQEKDDSKTKASTTTTTTTGQFGFGGKGLADQQPPIPGLEDEPFGS